MANHGLLVVALALHFLVPFCDDVLRMLCEGKMNSQIVKCSKRFSDEVQEFTVCVVALDLILFEAFLVKLNKIVGVSWFCSVAETRFRNLAYLQEVKNHVGVVDYDLRLLRRVK